MLGNNLPRYFFVKWFERRGRAFPWREKGLSPFSLLLAEMLLRQTRATAVAKLWGTFIERYPNSQTIAAANVAELESLIGILGFGTMRSAALIAASRWLLEKHEGFVPSTMNSLLRVPHIGSYAAHAVLCFGFGHSVEIVDTNVQRFISRFYGVRVKPDIRRNPVVSDIAKQMLPKNKQKVAPHNYGLLDFTAEICKPLNPLCDRCSLLKKCQFGRRGRSSSRKKARSYKANSSAS